MDFIDMRQRKKTKPKHYNNAVALVSIKEYICILAVKTFLHLVRIACPKYYKRMSICHDFQVTFFFKITCFW